MHEGVPSRGSLHLLALDPLEHWQWIAHVAILQAEGQHGWREGRTKNKSIGELRTNRYGEPARREYNLCVCGAHVLKLSRGFYRSFDILHAAQ